MGRFRYLDVCSGISAATVAWHSLGWTPAAFAEIEKFPSALLEYRYPFVPNRGDMTQFNKWPDESIDLLVGGTPCQAFSLAGLRKGLDDPRGNLTLTFLALVRRFRPAWLVWENVPGVLSDRTNAFGLFLSGLAELGYGWAYRVLDAQYFGVPQRRRRVFVVGYLGNWQRAAAVLFEPESLRGDRPPSREPRESIAPCLSARTKGGGGLGTDFECDGGLIAHSLRGEGFDASEDGTGRGTPLVPTVFNWQAGGTQTTLGANSSNAATLSKSQTQAITFNGAAVRRLTPRECERLQGFPDDYTLIPYRGKPAADGPRYKAIGNSMAVPCMHWIGNRINLMNTL